MPAVWIQHAKIQHAKIGLVNLFNVEIVFIIVK